MWIATLDTIKKLMGIFPELFVPMFRIFTGSTILEGVLVFNSLIT